MDIVREKVIRAADLQWGRLSRRQLRGLGASEARIARWVDDGYLRKVLPHVYAVGHVAESVGADLVAAILYSGPGAMLSHATALWWHGLLAQQPSTIQISTPRKCRSLPGIRVYARRKLELEHRRRLPTTTVSYALLDLAPPNLSTESCGRLRKQMRRYRRRELELRLGGYVVLRRSHDQILYEPEAVLADLRAALEDAAKRVARA